MKEIPCEVIRDLCPLYEKEEVSEVTKKVIEAHVEGCESCKTYYVQAKTENEQKKKMQEACYVKAASKLRVRKRFFLLKGLAIFSILLITFNSFFQITKMVSTSMKPVINVGDMCVINKKAYAFANPQKDDVIYYNNPQYMYNAIGRIIGCPGDHIVIKEGKLYVNDELYERYSQQEVLLRDLGSGEEKEKLNTVLDENEYFIMGDYVESACDSRHYGPFKRTNIKGKVILLEEQSVMQPEIAELESR